MICVCTSPGCLCSLFFVPEEQTLLELLKANHFYQPERHASSAESNLIFDLSDIRHTA
jgi:hypothetical protein